MFEGCEETVEFVHFLWKTGLTHAPALHRAAFCRRRPHTLQPSLAVAAQQAVLLGPDPACQAARVRGRANRRIFGCTTRAKSS